MHKHAGSHLAATDLRPCDYLGQAGTHLCWSEAHPSIKSDAVGLNRVASNAYEVVQEYEKFGRFHHSNPHEFNMLPGGQSFMQVSFKRVDMDLREYYGPRQGLVMDGCLQEVDTASGEMLFNWCFLDNKPVWETNVFPNNDKNTVNTTAPRAGLGTQVDPWDFIHMNSADKNTEGDYLLSARHLDQIIKIAGLNNKHGLAPGTIIWRLGGRTATIEMDDTGHFMRQHHARFHSLSATEEVISFFNNAWGGDAEVAASAPYSSGMLVSVNNKTKTSSVLRDWKAPHGERGYAMGGVQLLPNGNAHVGWGTYPAFSEYTEDGQVLFHANFAPDDVGTSYRAYKFPWVGMPNTKPKVVAYCGSCSGGDGPLTAYVSWNGATEVKRWRFHVSRNSRLGPWLPVGTFEKEGFETKVVLRDAYVPLVSVEALDEEGNVLDSTIVKTFVPIVGIGNCDDEKCNRPTHFEYVAAASQRCAGSLLHALYVLLFVIVGMECATSLVSNLIRICVDWAIGRGYKRLKSRKELV